MARGRFHKLFYALRQTISAQRPTFEKLFTGAKVKWEAQKDDVRHKTVHEIDLWFFVQTLKSSDKKVFHP